MGKILNDGKDPEAAANEWLKANPTAIDPWLAGVTTKDGAEGLPAVKTAPRSLTGLSKAGLGPRLFKRKSRLNRCHALPLLSLAQRTRRFSRGMANQP